MNLFEQLSLGGLCLARSLRETLRPGQWPAWFPLAGARVLLVVALAWAAHPLFSWLMAPLLRGLAGEDALRFPQALAGLARHATRGDLLVWTFVGLPCAAAATRRLAGVFGHPPRRTRGAAAEAVTVILAGLPAVLVAVGVQVALDALGHVRLSGFSRAMLPYLGSLLVLLAQAATFYVVAEVVLGGGGAGEAWAAVPRSWGPGFLPAVLVLALLSLPMLLFPAVEPGAAAGHWHRLPEAAVVVALAHALARTLVAMVATGAATLVWLAAVGPAGEGA